MLSITPFGHMDVRESRPPRQIRRRGDNRVDARPATPDRFRLS